MTTRIEKPEEGKARGGSRKRYTVQRTPQGPVVKPDGDTQAVQMDGAAATALSAEQHRAMIAQAAYYLAEKRGFTPGCELDDWLAAETEVKTLRLTQV